MADLTNALNDCIDRLGKGQSIEDCLRAYPEIANDLQVMLEAGKLAQRAHYRTAEVTLAQQRQRYKIEQAAANFQFQPVRSARRPLWAFARLAAVIILVIGAFGVLAQSSLPGDPLYGVKRFTENTRFTLSGNSVDLQRAIDARRVSEVQQLLTIRRAAEVTFHGQIEAVEANVWRIAGLPVQITADTAGLSALKTGDVVEVDGYTTAEGLLIANAVHPMGGGEPENLPIPTQTLTPFVPTTTATQSPIPTTATVTPTMTATPIIPTTTPTMTPTLTPTSAPSQSPTPVETVCAPQRPQGWEMYRVQPGDSLSDLAARRGVSLAQVMRVNCLTDPNILFAGETLYLPVLSSSTSIPVPQVQITEEAPQSGDQSGSGDSNNSGSGNQGSGDDHGGEDEGGDDHGGSGHS